jgi:hypothetical protein
MDQQESPAARQTPRDRPIYGPSIPLIQEEIYEDRSGRHQPGYSRNMRSAVFHQPDMTLHIDKSYFWEVSDRFGGFRLGILLLHHCVLSQYE